MTFNEPIPSDFYSANIELLESALGNPQQGTIDGLLYPTLEKQGAILFYSLIKNHPFKNGNKRLAVMALIVFIFLNNKWLNVSSDVLYNLALKVAQADSKDKFETLNEIELVVNEGLETINSKHS